MKNDQPRTRIAFIIISFLIANFCTAQSLTGKLTGPVEDYGYVYLLRMKNPQSFYNGSYALVFDSAKIDNEGRFIFPEFGKLDTNYVYRISVAPIDENPGQMMRDYVSNNYAFILSDGNSVELEGDIWSLFKTYSILTPLSPSMKTMMQIRNLELPFFSLVDTFWNEFRSKKPDSLALLAAQEKLQQKMINYFLASVAPFYMEICSVSNDERLVSYSLIELEQVKPMSQDISLYKTCIERFSTKDTLHPYISWWSKRIENEVKSIQLNEKAEDISGYTPAGESTRLYDVHAKLILIDFWASWCSPCRKENTETVLPLYKKYAEKGFEVFGITSDKSEILWKKAIEKDRVPWTQVTMPTDRLKLTHERYEVSSLPTTYIVDGNFKVIARDLRGEQLIEFVEKYFSN